jgi:hypothetical protein
VSFTSTLFFFFGYTIILVIFLFFNVNNLGANKKGLLHVTHDIISYHQTTSHNLWARKTERGPNVEITSHMVMAREKLMVKVCSWNMKFVRNELNHKLNSYKMFMMLYISIKSMQICPYSTRTTNLVNVYNYIFLIELHICNLHKLCIYYLCGTMGFYNIYPRPFRSLVILWRCFNAILNLCLWFFVFLQH